MNLRQQSAALRLLENWYRLWRIAEGDNPVAAAIARRELDLVSRETEVLIAESPYTAPKAKRIGKSPNFPDALKVTP